MLKLLPEALVLPLVGEGSSVVGFLQPCPFREDLYVIMVLMGWTEGASGLGKEALLVVEALGCWAMWEEDAEDTGMKIKPLIYNVFTFYTYVYGNELLDLGFKSFIYSCVYLYCCTHYTTCQRKRLTAFFSQ